MLPVAVVSPPLLHNEQRPPAEPSTSGARPLYKDPAASSYDLLYHDNTALPCFRGRILMARRCCRPAACCK